MEDELSSASEGIKMKEYYIIELDNPIQGNTKYMCLPKSCIDSVINDERVTVNIQVEQLALDDMSKEYCDLKHVEKLEVHVKLKTDSYERAQKYLNFLNTKTKSRKIKSPGKHSEGNDLLAAQDTGSSSPNMKFKSENRNILPADRYETVEKILVNVLEYFLEDTQGDPQKISDNASKNSVKSKIKKRKESSDCLYSQSEESKPANIHKTASEHLTKPTHNLSLARDDKYIEISDDDMEESEVSGIITKNQSSDKHCSQTEAVIRTNVLSTRKTEPNQTTNKHVNFCENTRTRDDKADSDDDDFENPANFAKVSKKKSSDYQYTQVLTNKPLRVKIKRTAVTPKKTVVDLDEEQRIATNVDCITLDQSRQELINHLSKDIEVSTNKESSLTIADEFIQSKSSLNMSNEQLNTSIQLTNNDQNKSIEHNNPSRLYEDIHKLRSQIDELTKQVIGQESLLARAYSEIEKNKYEIGKLKNIIHKFTNPQNELMDVQESNENGGKIERFDGLQSETSTHLHQVNQINKQRRSTICEEDKNKTRKKPSKQIILPKEYDKNDPRWTLKYRDIEEGLVELVKNSRIYVNETKLRSIVSKSKNFSQLARCLLVEVFSESALKTCTLTGAKRSAVIRPGLGNDAWRAILRFVAKHAHKQKWIFTSKSIITVMSNTVAQKKIKKPPKK